MNNAFIHLGLALLTLSCDKNWDSHSLVNGYPSLYPRIALVAPSPGRPMEAIVQWPSSNMADPHRFETESNPLTGKYGVYVSDIWCTCCSTHWTST